MFGNEGKESDPRQSAAADSKNAHVRMTAVECSHRFPRMRSAQNSVEVEEKSVYIKFKCGILL